MVISSSQLAFRGILLNGDTILCCSCLEVMSVFNVIHTKSCYEIMVNRHAYKFG